MSSNLFLIAFSKPTDPVTVKRLKIEDAADADATAFCTTAASSEIPKSQHCLLPLTSPEELI